MPAIRFAARAATLTILTGFAAACSSTPPPGPALDVQLAKQNLGAITCAEILYLSQSANEIERAQLGALGLILMGYRAGRSGNLDLSPEQLGAISVMLDAPCRKDPDKAIVDVIDAETPAAPRFTGS